MVLFRGRGKPAALACGSAHSMLTKGEVAVMMQQERRRALDFLAAHGMSYESLDMDELMKDFIDDMEQGLNGQVKSMLMVPTYLSFTDDVPRGVPITVVDAGGTNFRVAQVTLRDDGPPEIEYFAKYPMPGSNGRLSRSQFLETVADYMAPVAGKTDKVGFSFSFPIEILPSRDGRVIAFSKEVYVDDAEGILIGEDLNRVFATMGLTPKHFTVLNDAVAAMFAGVGVVAGKGYSGYIGLVLGTGTNVCYVERTENIKTVQSDCEYMAMNTESGIWTGVPQGDFDRELDDASINPHDHVFEKMVSGAYQGEVIRLALRGAAREGLFSAAFSAFIGDTSEISMFEVDEFCRYPFGDNTLANAVGDNDEDRRLLHYIIDACVERSAKIICANIGGIMLKQNLGTDPTRPACVIAEGTMFYKSELFRGKLEYYVKRELNERHGIYCEFIKVENATLIGTAIAGLMN